MKKFLEIKNINKHLDHKGSGLAISAQGRHNIERPCYEAHIKLQQLQKDSLQLELGRGHNIQGDGD